MAISNIHETLLMYTKQKSVLNAQLSGIMFNLLSASRKTAEVQAAYNEKVQDAYFDPDYGYGTEEYELILDEYERDHNFELASIESWESELDIQKANIETKLNEITTYEQSWQKLLSNNVKKDFQYGGGGQ